MAAELSDVLIAEIRELRAEVGAIGKSLAGCQAGCAKPAADRAGMVRTVITGSVSGLIVGALMLLLKLR